MAANFLDTCEQASFDQGPFILEILENSMRRLFFVFFLLVLPATALAGNAVLKKDGKSYTLNCSNAGCFIAERISFFKSGPQKRLGAGGAANFEKWKKKLKSDGYK
ncbi:hypothetical protein [Stappia sp. 28M-7]|uniref:hypothetical protein n=1 Tax=Stappia sp. 28M-7 TaxID=2762596 RepID=UPI00163C984A|nr:hypothetical protein [Stappia sp. 28M-7]MBC2860087.1 hypothetical protein [Stappia sp. 28M-7]